MLLLQARGLAAYEPSSLLPPPGSGVGVAQPPQGGVQSVMDVPLLRCVPSFFANMDAVLQYPQVTALTVAFPY